MKRAISLLTGILLLATSNIVVADGWFGWWIGLNAKARQELVDSGVTKYMGQFEPAASMDIGGGWTKHTFDPQNGEGPICIAGTPYSVFTRVRNPRKLLVFHQGGGACWQDFYFCNILAEEQEPPPPQVGIWNDGAIDPTSGKNLNPFADYSVVYLPYCDGSVFGGDNDVVDPNFPFNPFGIRFHRGLRNATAGMDLARDMFPRARKIVVSGSSAGGVGATAFSPFLARFAFGNWRQLSVLNDAGPIAINEFDVANIQARAADWDFDKFYPKSCTECDAFAGQGTEIVKWRMKNDRTVRESFYSTDGDETNRFFLQVPTQALYRQLIVSEHGEIRDRHPWRYKRFIVSGDDSHTALQTPLFYLQDANGVPLNEWVRDFLRPFKRRSVWDDIVEDFVPLP